MTFLERLGAFVVLEPPRVFSALWAALKPLVDPMTKAKLVFTGVADLDKALLGQHFGSEL